MVGLSSHSCVSEVLVSTLILAYIVRLLVRLRCEGPVIAPFILEQQWLEMLHVVQPEFGDRA